MAESMLPKLYKMEGLCFLTVGAAPSSMWLFFWPLLDVVCKL